ncbi:hypothetical protein ILUMI_07548 [Ignelater luminosus]|uniref:Uncharacterized protein n=1 Tax=Ignelater luminosus TaxID=2038154 RepID=A0A8K0D957_IGNLU|nr:hypothetical protein ILUMI_07548 [Ignelater luminosus]
MKIQLFLFFLLSLNIFTFAVVPYEGIFYVFAEVKQTKEDRAVCNYTLHTLVNSTGMWNFTVTVKTGLDNKYIDTIPFGFQIYCVLESKNVDLTIPPKGENIKKEIVVRWKKPVVEYGSAVCKTNQANSSNTGPTFSVQYDCNTQGLPISIIAAIKELKSIECVDIVIPFDK